MTKRVLLVARYYSIEPLGILYLAGIARDAGWDCRIVLVRECDFEPLYDAVHSWKPDLVGFQIWTGYHTPMFAACERVRAMGVPVVIGGPHATYFDDACALHADWVVKGGGFALFGQLLAGELSRGIHFSVSGREDAFPLPDRDRLYTEYPEFGESPIKSIFGSVGCPMRCTYCYAPAFNQMHGGFKLLARPVDELVAEAHELMRYPTKMVYFQDDIFGYPPKWVEEFAASWKREVGLPFHCQIRLELTRGDSGNRRLDFLAEAGCTGITLAIESGNEFLRDHVLFRHMNDELIVEGCRKIMERGMTLRTEQILSVPFSDIDTDLATLDLNHRINPTMAWTSILAPYAGTAMGTITRNFGFYTGNNDDLTETFFDRSVLRHVEGGSRPIGAIVAGLGKAAREGVLLRMHAEKRDDLSASVFHDGAQVGLLRYLDDAANEQYVESTVRLQRLFNWLAKVPGAESLGRRLCEVPEKNWSWGRIGTETGLHLNAMVGVDQAAYWEDRFEEECMTRFGHVPHPVVQNPFFFAFFPEGAGLVDKTVKAGAFEPGVSMQQTLDIVSTLARRHLFHFDLYRLEAGAAPIAS